MANFTEIPAPFLASIATDSETVPMLYSQIQRPRRGGRSRNRVEKLALGTRRMLELARASGVGRFVFPSSISARADAPAYYGRGKAAAEAALDPERDLVLRPGLVLARGGGLFRPDVHVARPVAVPIAPVLVAARVAEALGLRLPVTSENLLGLRALRRVEPSEVLAELGVRMRGAEESLDDLM